jgi:hypothetical protein
MIIAADEFDLSAMTMCDCSRDCQSETAAGALGCPQRFKQMVNRCGWNALARICEEELSLVRLEIHPGDYFNLSAVGHGIYAVVSKIQ